VRITRYRWAAALLAVAGCQLGATPASPVAATAVTVRQPAWWSGTCDYRHWNPAARARGWHGAGAHMLGASYLGVPVCGPRPAIDGSPDVEWHRAGWGYPEWQCTELAFRFMAQLYGVRAYGAAGGTVVPLYRPADGGALVRFRNGTVGHPPRPGDVISFTGRTIYDGHAAVVTASRVDSRGNGYVTLMSQDDTANGWRTMQIRRWHVAALGSMPAWGWLHDPRGRGTAK
jgi:hypothetical protein